MTNPASDPSLMLFSVISIFGSVVVYFWLYRRYRIALFRQRLFALRQEVFDVAWSGALSFTHPAYGLLRSTMNGFIRFGHRVNLLSIAWAAAESKSGRMKAVGVRGFQEQWDEAARELAPDVRKELEARISRMHRIVADHLVFTSTVFSFVLVVVVAMLFLAVCALALVRGGQSLVGGARGVVRSLLLDPIDSAALAEGMDPPAATKPPLHASFAT